MPNSGYILSDGERRIVQTVIDELRNQSQNTTQRPYWYPEEYLPPETFVAKVPSGGILALVEGVGTTEAAYPGYAECDIFRLINQNTSTPALTPVSQFQQTVYNLSSDDVPGDTWHIIQRDKYGDWYVKPSSEGGIDDTGTGTTGGGCDSFDFPQEMVDCVDGVLTVLTRTATISFNGEDGTSGDSPSSTFFSIVGFSFPLTEGDTSSTTSGCPTISFSDWTAIRYLGPCTSTTGTGTGSDVVPADCEGCHVEITNYTDIDIVNYFIGSPGIFYNIWTDGQPVEYRWKCKPGTNQCGWYNVCTCYWFCVTGCDEETGTGTSLKWWCVLSNQIGTDVDTNNICDDCCGEEDSPGFPLVWILTAPRVVGFEELEGDFTLLHRTVCHWGTETGNSISWDLGRTPTHYVITGFNISGMPVQAFLPKEDFNCCSTNVFVFSGLVGVASGWNGKSVTIVPATGCDCGDSTGTGTSTVPYPICVYADVEPPDAIDGPFATEAECYIACSGATYYCLLTEGFYDCYLLTDDELEELLLLGAELISVHINEEECLTACGENTGTGTGTGTGTTTNSIVTSCCEMPRVLDLAFSVAGSGDCVLTYDDGTDLWEGSGSFTVDGCSTVTINWEMRCSPEAPYAFELRHSCIGGLTWSDWLNVGLASLPCIPFLFIVSDYSLDVPGAGCSGCFAPEVTISGDA